jgi:pentatricopeptide repeat protein
MAGPIELPVAGHQDDRQPDELVYFAYAEKGDDVAFEMCGNIEEALGVYQIMREDGFEPRLFQAQEILIEES